MYLQKTYFFDLTKGSTIEPLSKLQALPTEAKPISSFSDRDAAFYDIMQGIKKAIEELKPQIDAVTIQHQESALRIEAEVVPYVPKRRASSILQTNTLPSTVIYTNKTVIHTKEMSSIRTTALLLTALACIIFLAISSIMFYKSAYDTSYRNFNSYFGNMFIWDTSNSSLPSPSPSPSFQFDNTPAILCIALVSSLFMIYLIISKFIYDKYYIIDRLLFFEKIIFSLLCFWGAIAGTYFLFIFLYSTYLLSSNYSVKNLVFFSIISFIFFLLGLTGALNIFQMLNKLQKYIYKGYLHLSITIAISILISFLYYCFNFFGNTIGQFCFFILEVGVLVFSPQWTTSFLRRAEEYSE